MQRISFWKGEMGILTWINHRALQVLHRVRVCPPTSLTSTETTPPSASFGTLQHFLFQSTLVQSLVTGFILSQVIPWALSTLFHQHYPCTAQRALPSPLPQQFTPTTGSLGIVIRKCQAEKSQVKNSFFRGNESLKCMTTLKATG